MAHFAKLDSNNNVTRVLVVDDSNSGGGELATENVGIGFLQNMFGGDTNWKQTSYNRNLRGNYAGIGYTYMTGVRTLCVASTDIFIDPQPAPSWSVGIQTAKWYPPDNPGEAPALTVSEADAGKYYEWDESRYTADPSTAWVLK